MTTLGQRLKELRESREMTQTELAEVLGLKTRRAIGYIEADQRGMDHQQLIAVADYFGVSLDFLTGRTDNPTRL